MFSTVCAILPHKNNVVCPPLRAFAETLNFTPSFSSASCVNVVRAVTTRQLRPRRCVRVQRAPTVARLEGDRERHPLERHGSFHTLTHRCRHLRQRPAAHLPDNTTETQNEAVYFSTVGGVGASRARRTSKTSSSCSCSTRRTSSSLRRACTSPPGHARVRRKEKGSGAAPDASGLGLVLVSW